MKNRECRSRLLDIKNPFFPCISTMYDSRSSPAAKRNPHFIIQNSQIRTFKAMGHFCIFVLLCTFHIWNYLLKITGSAVERSWLAVCFYCSYDVFSLSPVCDNTSLVNDPADQLLGRESITSQQNFQTCGVKRAKNLLWLIDLVKSLFLSSFRHQPSFSQAKEIKNLWMNTSNEFHLFLMLYNILMS